MIRLSGLIPGRDVQIEFTGLRPGEKLYEELLNKQEEVIPTHHKKIMIANARGQEYETVSTSVSYLIELAIENKDTEVVRQMKYIVPEYKSKNSAYEELDKEVTLTESMLNNYIVKEGLN
jgi:FlaA1/EpsC-like NDP-sugar epimerase